MFLAQVVKSGLALLRKDLDSHFIHFPQLRTANYAKYVIEAGTLCSALVSRPKQHRHSLSLSLQRRTLALRKRRIRCLSKCKRRKKKPKVEEWVSCVCDERSVHDDRELSSPMSVSAAIHIITEVRNILLNKATFNNFECAVSKMKRKNMVKIRRIC